MSTAAAQKWVTLKAVERVCSPDSFVRLHQDGAVWSGDGHGVVTYADLRLPEKSLATNLQALVKHGQEEDGHERTNHF